jgi:Coenzyme PQQ synthesis protein D (PqqD)
MNADEESKKKTPPMSPGQKLKVNPDVLFQRLENDAVLLHLKTDRFYDLNRTGTRFWELLSEGYDLVHIQEQMLKEFDVEPGILEKEIKDMIASLEKEDLIRVV